MMTTVLPTLASAQGKVVARGDAFFAGRIKRVVGVRSCGRPMLDVNQLD